MPIRTVSSPAEQSAPTPRAVKRGISPAVTLLLLILFVIAAAGFAWAFMNYLSYKKQVATLTTPAGQQQLAKEQTKALVDKVAKLIVLPKDEEPTIATVLDAPGLAKDQPFYKDAHNGDKVLIYVKAQKAIIYDEKQDKLINVGPVYIENRSQGAGSSSGAENQSASSSKSQQ